MEPSPHGPASSVYSPHNQRSRGPPSRVLTLAGSGKLELGNANRDSALAAPALGNAVPDTAAPFNLAPKQLTSRPPARSFTTTVRPPLREGGGGGEVAASSMFSLAGVIRAFQDPPILKQER